ncbi:DUF3821 domain-containing protein [Methanocalculus sp.]|uniref:DUF3821 domain-containing protein n=1 Tax=Methanocalculus sp. TaxID=2004547 RepID=UPI00262B0558|nr:DUF3821 domain-containing protein [Methanocalculus sp.]MDG6251386.1 DUF3821 domain-containing protein [Methanocalculus sp.]
MIQRETLRRIIHFGCIFIFALLFTSPAHAAISDIPANGMAFIGEEGLDVTACGIASGDTIGWFAPGSSPATGSPTATMIVSDATSFYVSPQTFQERTGSWYNIGTGNPAFSVADPYLEVRVYDLDYGVRDRTGLWVPMDFELQFRIVTNLDAMAERTGVTGAPIEIRVTREGGIEYSSLVNKAGVLTSLLFNVGNSPFLTGRVWYPESGYSRGVYEFYAFCNANQMKDNYNVVGKTITPRSETVSLSRTTPTTPTPAPTQTPIPTPKPTIVVTPPPTTAATPTQEPTPVATQEPTATPIPEPTPAPLALATTLGALALITRLRLRNK